jgi:hypothetical protein
MFPQFGPLVDGGGVIYVPGRGWVPVPPWRPDMVSHLSRHTSAFALFGSALDALPSDTVTIQHFLQEETRKNPQLLSTPDGQLELVNKALANEEVHRAIERIALHLGLSPSTQGDHAHRMKLQTAVEIAVGILVIGGLILILL